MQDEQYADVAASLKRATKSRKPYHWFFVAKGGDDKPVLLVGKREGEVKTEGKELKKGALDKKGGRGRIALDPEGKIVFVLDEGNAPTTLVQKAIRLKLATEKPLKKVKGLLQKSRVVLAEEAGNLFGSQQEEGGGLDLDKLTNKLDRARAASKQAWDQAVARLAGASHPDLQALATVQERAKAARQDGLAAQQAGDTAKAAARLEEALDLYEEIAEGAEAAGLEDGGTEQDEVESDEAEGDADVAATPRGQADPTELFESFKAAMEEVNGQIEALKKALKAAGDEELSDIAEMGLPALTKGHRVPLQAALIEAKAAPADKRAAALKKAADLAGRFLDHVENDEAFDACDDNPFGVKMTLRKSLGTALRHIQSAA